MKALSLFSGIGGIDLAAEWAGIETVAFCEREPFCQKVLKKHWSSIPIYDDVCTLTKERLEKDEINCDTIELIFSGDPCQPSSQAGKRQGADDNRHLWPEVNRLLQEIRPRWIVRENVVGNVTMGLDEVLINLDNLGYTSQSFIIPACAIGADHERDRVFVIGHSNGFPKSQTNQALMSIGAQRDAWENTSREFRGEVSTFYREENQPPVCRMDDGFSTRLYNGRMKALGNAVNPYQIFPLIAAIKQIEDAIRKENIA